MLVFWIFAILGMLDIDLIPTEIDEDVFDADVNLTGEVPGFVGLLHTLGLTGVPITIVVSIISLIGFTISYFVSGWILLPFDSVMIRYIAGTLVLLGGFGVAIPVTAKIIKPLKPLFVKHFAPSKKDYIGHVCTIASSTVSDTFGIGIVETGGAPLQINIRTANEKPFSKGMTVRIADYNEAQDIFDVISEEEFQNLVG
ncbi:MAG: hypothetical protein GY927_04870 [bacterium]|nr:hypothetical protein [bacterium]